VFVTYFLSSLMAPCVDNEVGDKYLIIAGSIVVSFASEIFSTISMSRIIQAVTALSQIGTLTVELDSNF
jgi:hypothetical protein